jgi:hypothetical protein
MEERAAISASLMSTNAQIGQLTAKVDELSKPEQGTVTAKATSGEQSVHAAKAGATRQRPMSAVAIFDLHAKELQAQLDEQAREIAEAAQSARTETGNSAASEHEEAAVQNKDARGNEFDIEKSKDFKSAGSVTLKLRKSDVKHESADLDLILNDHVITKKHVKLNEPTMFSVSDGQPSVQVVIDSISRDHVHGYVSEPKSGKAGMQTGNGSQATSTVSAVSAGQGLAMTGK